MRRYIALVQVSPDRGLSAQLPDFPGLFSAARSFDKLRHALGDHLASAIEEMERAGQALPEPSSFEKLMADPGNADRAALLVSAQRAKQNVAGEVRPAEPLHAQSNDEWPEAEA
ncbi:type II toxin-antitoxin system HicB family antitoxin [Methylocapsa sp. S129]|uniref:type II toxin-antitoxin system HicB family antitoxin n=1 Tax=Methylocapsa sp. S129 TaxID=1641869 RepID=UPI00131BCD91|nr:type II toxin-antitoxin system HicB family antitoxin [Methylocapsa sp. S129]